MSKTRDLTLYIVDIFIAIDRIKNYSSPFCNAQDLLFSELHWDGVLRELQIVGEATNKLLSANIIEQTYRLIVDFRNIITHGYFGIDAEIVWDVVTNDLVEYENYLKNLIQEKKVDINKALADAIKEQKALRNDRVVQYLESLYSDEF